MMMIDSHTFHPLLPAPRRRDIHTHTHSHLPRRAATVPCVVGGTKAKLLEMAKAATAERKALLLVLLELSMITCECVMV